MRYVVYSLKTGQYICVCLFFVQIISEGYDRIGYMAHTPRWDYNDKRIRSMATHGYGQFTPAGNNKARPVELAPGWTPHPRPSPEDRSVPRLYLI